MALTVLEKWNVFEGCGYILLGILFMAYPQIFDLFTNEDLTSSDYKTVQFSSAIIVVIGFFYFNSGLSYYFSFIVPKFVKNPELKVERGSIIIWSVITIFGRYIIVPVIVIIVLLTFSNTVITIFCIIFIVADPLLATITLFMVRYYGEEDYNKISKPLKQQQQQQEYQDEEEQQLQQT